MVQPCATSSPFGPYRAGVPHWPGMVELTTWTNTFVSGTESKVKVDVAPGWEMVAVTGGPSGVIVPVWSTSWNSRTVAVPGPFCAGPTRTVYVPSVGSLVAATLPLPSRMQPELSSDPSGALSSTASHWFVSVLLGTSTSTVSPALPVKCRVALDPVAGRSTVAGAPSTPKAPPFWAGGSGAWAGWDSASAVAKADSPVRPTSNSQSCRVAASVMPAPEHCDFAAARSGTELSETGACGKVRSVYVAVLVPGA